MATTLNNTTYNVVTVNEVDFMNDEIVCLKDGRHFLPAEIEVVADLAAKIQMQRELRILDRMIAAQEAVDASSTEWNSTELAILEDLFPVDVL